MTTGVYRAITYNLKLWQRKQNREGQLKWEPSEKKRIIKQELEEAEQQFERSWTVQDWMKQQKRDQAHKKSDFIKTKTHWEYVLHTHCFH